MNTGAATTFKEHERMSARYRVWCLSWDEGEQQGHDVVGYDLITGPPSQTEKRTIQAPFISDAETAAEAYADYVHSHRDGWESSWPLTFRVRLPDGTTEDYEIEREYEPTFSARKIEAK